jgi:acyl carrier protein
MISPQDVMAKIAILIGHENHEIHGDADLRELVTDSIDLVELVLGVQEAFGVRLMQEDLDKVATLADLATLVAARAGRASPS